MRHAEFGAPGRFLGRNMLLRRARVVTPVSGSGFLPLPPPHPMAPRCVQVENKGSLRQLGSEFGVQRTPSPGPGEPYWAKPEVISAGLLGGRGGALAGSSP